MANDDEERRITNRRARSRGGRRSTDPQRPRAPLPSCPACGGAGTASEAGAAEGGWWFVCEACDHLWDERARQTDAT